MCNNNGIISFILSLPSSAIDITWTRTRKYGITTALPTRKQRGCHEPTATLKELQKVLVACDNNLLYCLYVWTRGRVKKNKIYEVSQAFFANIVKSRCEMLIDPKRQNSKFKGVHINATSLLLFLHVFPQQIELYRL